MGRSMLFWLGIDKTTVRFLLVPRTIPQPVTGAKDVRSWAARSNSWNTEATYRGDLKTRQRYYGGATKRTRVPDTCVLLLYLSSGLSNRIVSWPIVGTWAGFLCTVDHHQSSPYKFKEVNEAGWIQFQIFQDFACLRHRRISMKLMMIFIGIAN